MTDTKRSPVTDLQRTLALLALQRSVGAGAWVEATGQSMRPGICPGDELYVEFGSSRPRLGEIVVFVDRGRVVAHRLLQRKRSASGEVFRTRGDNTVQFDRPFPFEQALGIVRACRRGGEPVTILDGGPEAAVAAGISLAAGCLLVATERLPATLRKPARRIVRRFAAAIVSRSVLALGRFRVLSSRRQLRPPGHEETPGAAGVLPEID
jgi:Peptidase S24-like